MTATTQRFVWHRSRRRAVNREKARPLKGSCLVVRQGARFFSIARSLPRMVLNEYLSCSGHFAFDPKEKFELKVSNRCYYFLEPPDKIGRKAHIFYCMKAYRDWPQTQNPQILTVGNVIESKDMRF